MSDIFDHALTAFESEMDYYDGTAVYEPSSGFRYNPLYYHVKISYNEILTETDLAVYMSYLNATVWIPKSIIQKHDIDAKSMYVHRDTFLKVCRGQHGKHI